MTTIERRVRIIQDTDPISPREWDNATKLYCWHDRYNLGDDHSYDCDDFIRDLAFESCDGLEDEVYRLENDVYSKLYEREFYYGNCALTDCNAYAEKWIRPRVDALIDKALRKGYVVKPIYMYDHSGIALSTGAFSCPWDSGQVGYAVMPRETVDNEFGGNEDKAEKCIDAEVEVYSDYVSGNVWGFVAEEREIDYCECEGGCDDCESKSDDEGWVDVDSCWGFYGRDTSTNGMADQIDNDFTEALACAEQVGL